MPTNRNDDDRKDGAGRLTRRAALMRLGLGAAAVYSAPVVLHLDRSANATVSVTPCSRGRGRKAPWCGRRDRHGHDDRRDHRDDDRHGGRSRGRDRGNSGSRGGSHSRGRG